MADFEPQTGYETSYQASPWYTFALERLVSVVRELSQARDIPTIMAIVRDAARVLTGADGVAMVLRDGDQCHYAEENAIAPLWKGKRFPMGMCVSGWVMLNRQAVVIEDIYADSRVPQEAYRRTFVKSLTMVPIRRNDPVGAIGAYWSTHYRPSPQEVDILEALADTTAVALENAELYARLQQQVSRLEAQQDKIERQHASLEVFTLALAHDLKEPVRTLVSYSGMLREDRQEENSGVYLDYIHRAAGRVDMLLNAVGHYTRLGEARGAVLAVCDLNAVLEGVREKLDGLLTKHDAELCHGDLPRLNADPAHMAQLLEHLIGNAILHNDRPVTITVGHRQRGGQAEFFVQDDGVGFDAGRAEQIFQPFRRLTHRDGCSGLGLSICRRIVARYGGEISCESATGQGASFTFTLPDTELAEGVMGFDPED